ncbi:MAG: signal peptidase I [Candidatus Cloacimonetes bacterium]|nr:signal peptidase I [Candidatus Cloacimonadota bacterium]
MAKVKKIVRKKHWIQDNFEALLFAFVVAMIIRNYTFQNFKIPSSSMESTLLIGDYLVANKVKYYFTDPKRDDIVTFQYPVDTVEPEPRERFVRLIKPIYWSKDKKFFKYHSKRNVVKRVVGMPGDKVEVRNKVVYINDEEYKTGFEQYIDRRYIPREYDGLIVEGKSFWRENMGSRDNFGPVVVPQGKYFVLGDNRDVSADSRFWGFLDRKDITGSPALIFFSIDEVYKQIRWDRFMKLVK